METINLQDIFDDAEEVIANQQVIKELAHYTSIEVLQSIIHSIESSENNNDLVLWATDARNSNDTLELQEGYQFLIESLKSYELIAPEIPEFLRLSIFLTDAKNSEKYHIYEKEDFLSWFFEGIRTPYIISFSRKVDNLQMWQKPYGRAGAGCCLVFDFSRMNYDNSELCVNSPIPIYYKDRLGYLGITSALTTLIFDEYNHYLRKISGAENHDELLEHKLQTIDILFAFISTYIKSDKWHDEQEWRLMCSTNDEHSDCVKYDNNGRPFVEVSVLLICLKKVILGPKVSPTIVDECSRYARLLHLSPDDIIKSKEPLR